MTTCERQDFEVCLSREKGLLKNQYQHRNQFYKQNKCQSWKTKFNGQLCYKRIKYPNYEAQ